MQEPQCDMSYSSVAPQLARKTPKFSVFNGDLTQKTEVSFKQWVFEVKGVMQSPREAILREGIVHSLWGAVADLFQSLGLHGAVSHIINKLELMCGTIASFNILMQNFYKLQQGRMERVLICVIQLEGVLNVVQQEYPNMLHASKVQKQLRDNLFQGL